MTSSPFERHWYTRSSVAVQGGRHIETPNQRLRRDFSQARINARAEEAKPPTLPQVPSSGRAAGGLLTPEDWAQRLGLSVVWVREKLRNKELPGFQLSSGPYLRWADAKALIVERLGPAAASVLTASRRTDPDGRVSSTQLAGMLGANALDIRRAFERDEIAHVHHPTKGPWRSRQSDYEQYVNSQALGGLRPGPQPRDHDR